MAIMKELDLLLKEKKINVDTTKLVLYKDTNGEYFIAHHLCKKIEYHKDETTGNIQPFYVDGAGHKYFFTERIALKCDAGIWVELYEMGQWYLEHHKDMAKELGLYNIDLFRWFVANKHTNALEVTNDVAKVLIKNYKE